MDVMIESPLSRLSERSDYKCLVCEKKAEYEKTVSLYHKGNIGSLPGVAYMKLCEGHKGIYDGLNKDFPKRKSFFDETLELNR